MITSLFNTHLYKHQKEVLKKMSKDALIGRMAPLAYAYFMEMGTGKSRTVLAEILKLALNNRINGAIIVAPKGMYLNWIAEMEKFYVHFLNFEYSVLVWNGKVTQKFKNKNINILNMRKFSFFIMNVEALSSSTSRATHYLKEFLEKKKSFFVLDESTTIKNPKAKRTEVLLSLALRSAYRRILSGLPVTKNPCDLYSQCEFLEPEILGFKSFYSFRNYYARMEKCTNSNGHSYSKIIDFKNLEQLKRSVSQFSVVLLKKDCLSLPDKIYEVWSIEHTEEQKKYSVIVKNEILQMLQGKEHQKISVSNALVKLLKLHQISCGFLKSEDGKILKIDSNRTKELLKLIELIDGKIIIWCNFIHNIKEIELLLIQEFGENTVATYYGASSLKNREITVSRFQDSSSPLRFLIANQQTAGYGLTLTEAHTAIYFSNNFNLEHRAQSEDRLHRIGQKNKVTYFDLIANNTIDEKIVEVLKFKKNLADYMVHDLQWIIK